MSTEIVKHQAAPAASLPEKMQYAKALAASGMLPGQYRQQPANLLYALEYAESLGLHPMAAITGIHVIEGKPSASAGLISALVRRAGHKLRVKGDDKQAVAQIIRADDPDFVYEVVWTMARAEQAGLARKDVWKKYPAAMLKARAITEVARDACEEALSGMHYTPEELGANVDQDGEPVAAEVQQLRRVEPGQADQWTTPTPQPETAAHGRDYLHEAHQAADADAVRGIYREAASDGAVPEYLAQIAEVGKEKAAAEQQDDVVEGEVVETGSTPHSMSDAVAAEPTVTTEADAAERELRAAAAKAGLTNLDEEFERSYGLPIREAGAQQMREMTGLLTGTAA